MRIVSIYHAVGFDVRVVVRSSWERWRARSSPVGPQARLEFECYNKELSNRMFVLNPGLGIPEFSGNSDQAQN